VIERMNCPIGVPGIDGKEPGVIAVAVAVAVAAQLQQAAAG
jgi:xanthine/CO dehydrogenase XdhC/CoxF family maturation factor